MNNLGQLISCVPGSFHSHSSRGAMKTVLAVNRSGFFRVIRVIVVGPLRGR